jgi:hypothetical protein
MVILLQTAQIGRGNYYEEMWISIARLLEQLVSKSLDVSAIKC